MPYCALLHRLSSMETSSTHAFLQNYSFQHLEFASGIWYFPAYICIDFAQPWVLIPKHDFRLNPIKWVAVTIFQIWDLLLAIFNVGTEFNCNIRIRSLILQRFWPFPWVCRFKAWSFTVPHFSVRPMSLLTSLDTRHLCPDSRMEFSECFRSDLYWKV